MDFLKMSEPKKIKVLLSLLFFITGGSIVIAEAFAEGQIKIPQGTINKLKESAREDEREAKKHMGKKEKIEEKLLKIIEEAKRRGVRIENKKEK
jgi:hypothetical protein